MSPYMAFGEKAILVQRFLWHKMLEEEGLAGNLAFRGAGTRVWQQFVPFKDNLGKPLPPTLDPTLEWAVNMDGAWIPVSVN